MYLPLDHHLPDFLRQASRWVLLLYPQAVPPSHLHLTSPPECRRLAVLQVHSLRLHLLNLFPTSKSNPTATNITSRASNVETVLGTYHSSP